LTNDQSYKAEFGISVASNTANKQLNLWD
jgi:hypothetical protein